MEHVPWIRRERKEINPPDPRGKKTSLLTGTARGDGEVWRAPEMSMLQTKGDHSARGGKSGMKMGGWGEDGVMMG